MTYSAPSTQAVDYLVTAADWNQDVVNNIIAIHDCPAARAYHNTTQTVGTGGSGTALALNSEQFDNDTIHDTSTNNSRLTATTAGVYLITGSFGVTHNAGRYIAEILYNGTTVIGRNGMYNTGSSQGVTVAVAALYKLSASDYVQLRVYQDSGTTATVVSSGNYSPYFGMQWVGAGT